MSTTYYICRKKEYERAEAITNYVDRIQRTLHSYLDVSLPPELKDDLQLTDDLEDAVGPMCSMLSQHIGYSRRFAFALALAVGLFGTVMKQPKPASENRMSWW